MAAWTAVQIAEFVSRKRAYGGALAAVYFLAIQWLVRPALVVGGTSPYRGRIDWWAINAVLLVLLVATRGGLFWNRRIRTLVMDELSAVHHRLAIVWGYWTAIVAALVVYAAAGRLPLTGRGAAYLVVTPSVAVPLLVFAVLQYRAGAERDE